MFSHGQVINAVAWLIKRRPQILDGRAMADWREYEITNHVPNGGGYLLTKSLDDAAWSVSTSLLGERVEASPQVGCPLSCDSAMQSQPSIHEARTAVQSSQEGTVDEHAQGELSAREVGQVLRDVTWGRRLMTKVGHESWGGIYAGNFRVLIDGWELLIYNDCDELDYCEECISPDGRRWSFDSGARFGTDPTALLSTWEHHTLEKLLKAL